MSTTAEKEALTVGEVARAAGVAPSAVRFYEKHAVVMARRDSGNRRRFEESAGCRIKVAKLAQRVGLTLREIADLFAELPHEPGPPDWERVASQLIAESERRTKELHDCLAELQSGEKLCGAVDRMAHP
ncbi:MerR family transcriptional regulator [Ruania rhizosphaerae]|uniref:MerR family transcriptional regulator n=1 Tax=Ruania rhizosphaerae TaxID=1840413 RepID=UPI00135C316E|nr:MerR family transcriptional regulator [Ruania rhizosphaerae]